MSGLKPNAETIAEDLAQRCDFSMPAVMHMMRAVDAGWGGMASFDHPEFGGPGQWMQGGMVMLGDPFDHALRGRVDALCSEIAGIYELDGPLTEREDSVNAPEWPESLGPPGATGSQGDLHYAYFPEHRRLALLRHGRLQIFDTGDHRITGVAQQQGSAGGDVRFTSQHGIVDLDALSPIEAGTQTAPQAEPAPTSETDVISLIERLGALRERGLISDEEFAAKKAELLARL